VRKIKAAFKLYERYQLVFAYTQNIKLTQFMNNSYVPFYLKKQGKRIDTFEQSLREAIKRNGMRLTSVKSRKTVSKIKIRFDQNEPLKIKAIFAKKKGCQYERLRGIDRLKETNSTTMNYVANLEKMIETLSFSNEEVPWLDFLAENTYPALEINFGDIDNNEEPLNSCIDQQSVQNLKDNVLKGLMTFSEVIQFSLSTSKCRTIEEIAENNPYEKQRFNLKESLKRQKQKRKQKREEKRLSREEEQELQDSVSILEEAIESGPNRSELQQIIEELQEYKAKLFLRESDSLDTLKLLRNQKKINNSIINTLNNRVDNIKKELNEIEESDLLDPIRVNKNSLQQELGSVLLRIEKLEQQNKEFSKQIDEQKDQNKKQRRDKVKDKAKLTYEKLKDLSKEAYEQNRKEITLTDELKNLKNKEKDGRTLLEKLNPCKWDNVSMKVIECLLGGMSFSEAIPVIIKATLKNTNPYVLENLLIGLPMEERKQVIEKVKKELAKVSRELAENFKEPWDEQREKDSAEEVADSSDDNQKILDQNPAEIEVRKRNEDELKDLSELKKKIDEKKKTIENLNKDIVELQKQAQEQSEIGKSAINETIKDRELRIKAREEEIRTLEEKYVKGVKEIQLEKRNTSASPALANAAGIVFDAYIEAITNTLSVDRLTNLLDKIPGANIFKKLLIELTCPRVNTLRSGVKDLFGSLSIEFCEPGAKGYFLPAIPDLPRFRGIGLKFALDIMIQKFKDALVDLISQLILSLIIRILDLIENGLCNSIGVLGALLANALSGSKTKQG
jgi:hypothetical protein